MFRLLNQPTSEIDHQLITELNDRDLLQVNGSYGGGHGDHDGHGDHWRHRWHHYHHHHHHHHRHYYDDGDCSCDY